MAEERDPRPRRCGICATLAALAVTTIVLGGSAHGQDVPSQVPSDAPADEVADKPDETAAEPAPADPRPVAADFAGAPSAENASGVRVPERRSHPWLWIPRVALFVPRWVLEGVFAPFRASLWAYERYQLGDRAKGIFFNDAGTVGAYPVAFFETGFGLNVGGRVILRDLIAPESRIRLRASYGGRYRQLYSAAATTGKLLGDRVSFELESEFEVFPKSRFFGIGNGDETPFDPAAAPVDPLRDDTAVATRYRHDDYRVELAVVSQLLDRVSLRASGAARLRSFRDNADLGGDRDIFEVYDRTQLVGFDDGLTNFYGELELSYDSRHVEGFDLSAATPAHGWKLTGFAGYARGIGDDPSDYVRYGADIKKFVDVYGGDRILILRAFLEGVTGDADKVPFVDLPRLGGPLFLRGFERDRFRDRVAGFASAEYMYRASPSVSGFVFVDTGRVWRALPDVNASNLRLGYGGGVQLHSIDTFRARLFAASSTDGGLFFNLSFDPVYDTRARQERP